MHDARVLVVDDSAAMRALFSDLLEQSKNVRVVGVAADAAEARGMLDELQPNVLTLDVEMPGMSGMEFLEEIMKSNPRPVVMLSSLTQKGTETTLKAYELGAVECFPKPLNVSPEEFKKITGKLGKMVLAAANSNVRKAPRGEKPKAQEQKAFEWNGQIIALSASMGGIDALTEMLPSWPANCPPTVVVLQTEQAVAEAFVGSIGKEIPCEIRMAEDGAALEQGVIHIVADPSKHVVFENGEPAKIKLMEREPVAGFRPSANLFYGTIARAGVKAAAAVLTGLGDDGAKGLKLMMDAGSTTFAQTKESAIVSEAPTAAIDAGGAQQVLPPDDLAAALIDACRA